MKIPLPVTPRVVALSYQKHLRGLHRLLLQCDLFTPSHQASTATPTTCTSDSTPPSAPSAVTSVTSGTPSPYSTESPLDVSPTATSEGNSTIVSTYTPPTEASHTGVSNPVFEQDSQNQTPQLENRTYHCHHKPSAPKEASQGFNNRFSDGAHPTTRPSSCHSNGKPRRVTREDQTTVNGVDHQSSHNQDSSQREHLHRPRPSTWDNLPQTADCSGGLGIPSHNHPSQQRLSGNGSYASPYRRGHSSHGSHRSVNCRCDRRHQNREPNQSSSCTREESQGHPGPRVSAASPFTTSGSSDQSVENRKKAARVSWSLDPVDASHLVPCQNNNTKPLPGVDIASTVPTHASPALQRSQQPDPQPPYTTNLNVPCRNHHNSSPRHNHSGKHNNYQNLQQPQPNHQQHYKSSQIPPPGREHNYPYQNHHQRAPTYPYHILAPPAPATAATKASPPPPPPPQSPAGSGGRSSPPPPPPPPATPQAPGKTTTFGPEPLAAGGLRPRKPPAPLRPGVAAGPGLSRGTSGPIVPGSASAMSCPSGQACSMGGNGNNGAGGNGNGGGTVGTDVQRRNLGGYGGTGGTSAASGGPGKRSLQHQNPEKHMEACARMPEEDITVMDENPVLIVPVQEPEPRPSTKISLPTVKSKVGVAGATKR